MACFLAFAEDLWSHFVAERLPGWKNVLHLFTLCCTVSLVATAFLFLAAYSLIVDYPVFFVVMAAFLWIALSIGLYFSKHLRCFFAVFFLSCGLREGRNTLIAVGSGVVVASNIQNIFYNLKQLADSVSCILDSQHFSFLSHYIKAIQWIYYQMKKLGNPFKDVVSVDDKLNVSYSVSDEDLKIKLNTTKLYIQNVANQISSVLAVQPYLGKKVLPLVGTAFILFGTYNFLRKFLKPHNFKFKNTYITKGFVRYDEQLWQQQKPSVFPLNKKEKKLYATVPSFCQTRKERQHVVRFFLPVLANLCIWAFFAAVDYLLYWLIFSVTKHLQDFPELDVHLKLYYHKNADKFIFNRGEVVDSIISFKITLFEDSCIPTPRFSHSETWIQLAIIIFFLTILGLMASTLMQLKILVATSFFPDRGKKRMEYLHSKLLNRRSKASERNTKTKWNSFAMLEFWLPVIHSVRSSRNEKKTMLRTDNSV